MRITDGGVQDRNMRCFQGEVPRLSTQKIRRAAGPVPSGDPSPQMATQAQAATAASRLIPCEMARKAATIAEREQPTAVILWVHTLGEE